jgi:hypothetical protein
MCGSNTKNPIKNRLGSYNISLSNENIRQTVKSCDLQLVVMFGFANRILREKASPRKVAPSKQQMSAIDKSPNSSSKIARFISDLRGCIKTLKCTHMIAS